MSTVFDCSAIGGSERRHAAAGGSRHTARRVAGTLCVSSVNNGTHCRRDRYPDTNLRSPEVPACPQPSGRSSASVRRCGTLPARQAPDGRGSRCAPTWQAPTARWSARSCARPARLDELEACVASGAARPSAIGIIGTSASSTGGADGGARRRAGRGAPRGGHARAARPHRPLPRAPPPRGGGRPSTRWCRRGPGPRFAAGASPTAVPTVEWLAEVLVGCVERGLQLKATAGLHHAFRAGRHEAPRHGFVNLLAGRGGGPLAGAGRRGGRGAGRRGGRRGRPAGRVAGARSCSRRSAPARSTSPSASWRCRGLL